MVFSHFRTQSSIRVVFLGLTLAVFVYLGLDTDFYATLVLVGVLIIYQVVSLIHSVELTNRQLTRFLQSIEYADLSQTFTGRKLGSSFDELYTAFTEVTNAFRTVRAEREEQYRYLQTVVQHVGVGVTVFQQNGTVELMNNTAHQLLRISGGAGGKIHNLSVVAESEPALVDKLMRMKAGERALVKVGELQLALHAAEFRLQDRALKLVSIQNIQTELEEKEMEAWANLIRVLTHEIMNSVTPIASLASTANDVIETDLKQETDNDAMEDIRIALKTIESRCKGLVHFVQFYRSLTRIPPPSFQIMPVIQLFGHITHLLQPQLEKKQISLEISAEPETLEITLDPQLIEQVLINLMTNAIQALQDHSAPTIQLIGGQDTQGRLVIQVTDNGPGILQDVQEKIFIPFFTTKQGGSGIGLSLSRQIMRMHRGTITVVSTPDVQTTFTLRF